MPSTSLSSNHLSGPSDSVRPSLKCGVSADFEYPHFQGHNIPEPLDICAKLVAFREGRKEGNVIIDR